MKFRLIKSRIIARWKRQTLTVLFISILFGTSLSALEPAPLPDMLPESPATEPTVDRYQFPGVDSGPTAVAPLGFCSLWNPDFGYNGGHCCRKFVVHRRRHRMAARCAAERRKKSYCDEMTSEQIHDSDEISSGKLGDVLTLISTQVGRRNQSFCTVNTGFLAYGRRLAPSALNRIQLRSPDRCTEFGTDAMVGMVETLGRSVKSQYTAPEYDGVRLTVGDISAPRGGCLGHASHMTGQDVDIGFLTVQENHHSPIEFHRNFDGKNNWWLVKKIFENPFACVKVIFLDRKDIRKLQTAARAEPELWSRYGRFVRHSPNHRNHLHVRIGDAPGRPGCAIDARPELEQEDDQSADSGETQPDLSDLQQGL